MSKKKNVFLLVISILILWAAVFAIETGEIKGLVLDQNGQGLMGVEITAKSRNGLDRQ